MFDQFIQSFVLDVNSRLYCQFVTFLWLVSDLLVIFLRVFQGAVLNNYPLAAS